MYSNTHFLEESDAWEKLLAENRAGLSLDTRRVKELREQLREAEQRAADAGIIYMACVEAHEDWKRKEANAEPTDR